MEEEVNAGKAAGAPGARSARARRTPKNPSTTHCDPSERAPRRDHSTRATWDRRHPCRHSGRLVPPARRASAERAPGAPAPRPAWTSSSTQSAGGARDSAPPARFRIRRLRPSRRRPEDKEDALRACLRRTEGEELSQCRQAALSFTHIFVLRRAASRLWKTRKTSRLDSRRRTR